MTKSTVHTEQTACAMKGGTAAFATGIAAPGLNSSKGRHRTCGRTTEMDGRVRMEVPIGARVRVVAPDLTMYQLIAFKPLVVTGMEGVVINDVSLQDGVEMSATAPYVVKLDEYPRKKAHFTEDELEILEMPASDEESS